MIPRAGAYFYMYLSVIKQEPIPIFLYLLMRIVLFDATRNIGNGSALWYEKVKNYIASYPTTRYILLCCRLLTLLFTFTNFF